MNSNQPERKRNTWQLVLGLVFIGYGSYRLYYTINSPEEDTLGMVLAIGFIAFGIYDLYKYYNRT
ncbi:hypothetical protein RM545_16820 [Zunongwangia sp. F260]|uniref:TM2 domain-containing protein n=1 Tax=Autumnicola lenta TaxID=3075593 RepID=A0ABU3CPV4_9FLAO|nr:hypothetical protein [Zunongwangia sp. F260]MDT0648356.1 hypothetical protein [Zunongwangia sp. F260]